MKFINVVVFFLVIFLSSQSSFSQDSAAQIQPALVTQMLDTTIVLDVSFKIRNVYARKDRYDAIRDSIKAALIWSSKMHDTVIVLDQSFIVENIYADKDSLEAIVDPLTTKRIAMRDSLNAIGLALMHGADMQDTTIGLDPSYILRDVYAKKDSLRAIRDSIRALLVQASQMQDTVIELESSFSVRNLYVAKDRTDAIRDSIARPTIMQDTLIVLDPDFIVRDLYPVKDSLDVIRDSIDLVKYTLKARADSVYADSVHRHWAGWKKYEVQPSLSYTLNSQKVLKAKSKAALQYNIADFYLYLNGELVRSAKSAMGFFAAGCLAFVSDDTLLLNSGLGFKVGVGVGIKIFQGKFISILHANTGNEEVYKFSEDDDLYKKSLVVEPVTQSLKLRSDPAYGGDIITGEYQATYKKFYQKRDDGDNDERRYNVKIIFRCRVSGGINNRLR